eukprot:11158024-Ditylum_brightwellii.AAC.1
MELATLEVQNSACVSGPSTSVGCVRSSVENDVVMWQPRQNAKKLASLCSFLGFDASSGLLGDAIEALLFICLLDIMQQYIGNK